MITMSQVIKDDNLNLTLTRNFYDKTKSDKIFKEFVENIVYDESAQVVVYGKTFNLPRKQVAYGDKGLIYKYSGYTSHAKKWPLFLKKIKHDIEKHTNQKFNFCLVNCYENGSHYISYHKDDEKELKSDSSIASLSFGCSRKFFFKSDNNQIEKIKLILNNGDLLTIDNPTNKYWKHSVPKEKLSKIPLDNQKRINLTFRNILI